MKDNIIQFVPSSCVDLSTREYILFKSQKLKTSYLLDILHIFITKYYFQGTGNQNLWSYLLKQKYGKFYHLYIEYLQAEGYLKLNKNYSSGNHSREWSLNPILLKEEVVRIRNFDKKLVKLQQTKNSFINNLPLWVPNSLGFWLKNNFKELDIDYKSSLNWIQENLEGESFYKNLISIDSIENRNFYFQFDAYGRLHTNLTNLKTEIRDSCLTIKSSKVSSLDIKNSQPLFLTKIIPPQFRDSNWLEMVYEDSVYETWSGLLENETKKEISRKESKRKLFLILFGKENYTNPEKELFKENWPLVSEWLNETKREKGYKHISHLLQKEESKWLFDLCWDLKNSSPSRPIFTVHDSIYFPESELLEVQSFWNFNLNDLKQKIFNTNVF